MIVTGAVLGESNVRPVVLETKANDEFFEGPDDAAVLVVIRPDGEFVVDGLAKLTIKQAREHVVHVERAIQTAELCLERTLTTNE